MATPTPATCQSQFEQGVAIALHLWPALSLAVQNNWGGPDSADKRDWFAGAIVDLFPDLNKVLAPASEKQQQQTTTQKSSGDDHHDEATEEPDQLDIETVLLQVMLDEFEVNVDDDSAFEVAEQILRVRLGCLKGKFDEVDALRRRFEGKGGNKNVVFKKAEDQDNDTDWDTDDDEEADSDEEMGEAPALVPTQPKEKVEPEVDEDGFTKVVGKKRR
ncbi:Pre-rRNA-processing protein TSR2-domain-containing protein [Sordaria brevicollis]|uniref:Pre-rRNA-processing protein TSR2-domain-containing protein n=1 Tax=Sordaria brevicollis TaxID=83679 RepID=A0AAE0PLJ0_SORBR|nr:Pre-rRNA-processing protein TSR2-domain-containing protein [Sordaria brevicollis]